MTSITMELETITPERAKDMLTRNTNNRALQKGTVTSYARQMKNGVWLLNGDAIRFSDEGVLLDGQHRLAAVVMSGASIQAWVGRGFPAEAQMTMDGQRKRTAGDVLNLRGFSNGNKVAACVRMVYRWDQGERSMLSFGGNAAHLSSLEVAKIVESDESFSHAVAQTHPAHSLAPVRVIATLHVLTSRLDVNKTQQFFEQLASGANLAEGNPILTLRRYWARLQNSTGSIPPGQYLMAGVRAWNAWAEGRTLTQIAYKTFIIPEVVSPRIDIAGIYPTESPTVAPTVAPTLVSETVI